MATKTIKASGGDYTSVTAWLASLPSTLTEAEIALVDAFQINETSGVGVTKVTSVTNYLEIRAASGHEHTGIAGTGPVINTTGGSGLVISSNHVRVVGMEVFTTSTTQNTVSIPSTTTYSADSDIRLEKCIIRGTKTGTTNVTLCTGNGANVTFDNNIIYGSSRLMDARVLNAGTVKLRNNIFWGHASQLLLLCDSHTTESYNNYVGCAASGAECFWTGGSTPTGSYNVSSDATATVDFPTGSQINIAGSSVFTSVTSTAEDFRPLNGTTALHNTGTTIASVTTDAIGTARPQGASYDVGAFEYIEGATTHATTGSLISADAVIAGSSARSGAAVTHATTGGLTVDSATIAGASDLDPLITIHATSGALATASATVAGSATLTAVVLGTITTPPIKNNTGTVRASLSGWTVNVYDATTGALVVQKTGLSTDASGVLTITDELIVPTTTYSYEPVHATYGRRLPTASAT